MLFRTTRTSCSLGGREGGAAQRSLLSVRVVTQLARGAPPPLTAAIDITEEPRGGGPPFLQHLLIVLGNSAGSRRGRARLFEIISILLHHSFRQPRTLSPKGGSNLAKLNDLLI